MTLDYEVTMVGGPCDRCGKAEDARPWRFTLTITHYGRTIRFPWLCVPCIKREKEKAWKARREVLAT